MEASFVHSSGTRSEDLTQRLVWRVQAMGTAMGPTPLAHRVAAPTGSARPRERVSVLTTLSILVLRRTPSPAREGSVCVCVSVHVGE